MTQLMKLKRELQRVREARERIQAQIQRLENSFEVESMMEKIRLETELKVLEEVESRLKAQIEEQEDILKTELPKLQSKYQERLMVFREKLICLKKAYDEFTKAFSDAEKSLEAVLDAHRPLSNVCHELSLPCPSKHPNGLFLDGRTRARLKDFGEWLTEAINS